MADSPIPVLVVDDDVATRLLVSEALAADGFAPVEAEDGAQALAQLAAAAPAAILLDVHMPGLDGYEVCRRIRQTPVGAAVSIMVMTASDDVDAVRSAFAAGATDFLTKPLNLPLLAHRVRYMLRAAATATAAREAAARLARAQRLARLVHWQLGPDDRFAWASDPAAVFWPDAPPGTALPADLRALVHPDDRARVEAALRTRTGHRLDFRLRLPDGSERRVHQDAAVDHGERGAVLIGATQDVTDQKRAELQIAQLAFYDDLTGIPNRAFVERYLRAATPERPRVAVAIELGAGALGRDATAVRDALIRAVAARVIERVRGADLRVRLDQAPISPDEPGALSSEAWPTVVARPEPDELFVVTSERIGAGSLARQLADALAVPIQIGGRELVLRPRVGAVDYPQPEGDLRRLYDHARAAMLEAEPAPPRNVVVVSAAAREQRQRRGELARQLADALTAAADGPTAELACTYGARVEPYSRALVGVRAAARWQPAVQDPRALADALAAEPALRDRLARWMLTRVCQDVGRWQGAGASVRAALEVPYPVVATPLFAGALARALADDAADPATLDLELSELPSTPTELARAQEVLGALRALGPRLILARIDDGCTVGTLARLPLDGLRLDRPTIERLGGAFVGQIAAIARALSLRLAAAELDAPSALADLDDDGVDELAGALFGAPVLAAQVPELTARAIAERSRLPTCDVSVVRPG